MKRVFMMMMVGMLVIGLSLTSIACTGNGYKSLSVSIDDKIIKSVRLNDADGIYTFKDNFKREDLDNSEFVEFGEKLYLDFGDSMPDKVVVEDSILTPDGKFMYDMQATSVFTCGRDQNGFYFVVDKNLSSAFSSVFEEGRKDLRGFMIRAVWGSDELVYGFVIKTKAII